MAEAQEWERSQITACQWPKLTMTQVEISGVICKQKNIALTFIAPCENYYSKPVMFWRVQETNHKPFRLARNASRLKPAQFAKKTRCTDTSKLLLVVSDRFNHIHMDIVCPLLPSKEYR
ncbi:unnamed protein product [Protopolystoma xenopodis]|uniref:Uncharacterized protein n=1 Tax=Protopolystoma xenopodis TaxID=117903 RepID=A0A3S4ZVE4_9PLAT|nr:unnamed protein product [Protopolystoma xenopodis]